MEKTFEERWGELTQFMEERFEKMPNLESILFLVGLNEYTGRIPKIKFSKEQKQELMHVGLCAVLSLAGYYQFVFRDDEGWPHYHKVLVEQPEDLDGQEELIKQHLLTYFGF